ncbi:hypothetical protein FKP32DRAFT_185157 [Trametes sanguinea]|nr:hypothetical protein FKP32DRAFT_185157 [Trametes sanguinea]
MLTAEQGRESKCGSQGYGVSDRFRWAQGSRSHRTILSGRFGATSMTAVHTPRPGVEIFPHGGDGQVRTRQQAGGVSGATVCVSNGAGEELRWPRSSRASSEPPVNFRDHKARIRVAQTPKDPRYQMPTQSKEVELVLPERRQRGTAVATSRCDLGMARPIFKRKF